jgi:hypothetical protein
MRTTLNLILVVLVLILAASLSPEDERETLRRSMLIGGIMAALGYCVVRFVAGPFIAWVYEDIEVKITVAILLGLCALAAILVCWRHDAKDNRKIRAGDADAFDRRVERLMRTGKSREQAFEAVQSLKQGNDSM